MKFVLLTLAIVATVSSFAATENTQSLGEYSWKTNGNTFSAILIAKSNSFVLKDIDNYQVNAAKFLCRSFLESYGSENNHKYDFTGIAYKESEKGKAIDILKIGALARARGVEGDYKTQCGPCGNKKRLKAIECKFNQVY